MLPNSSHLPNSNCGGELGGDGSNGSFAYTNPGGSWDSPNSATERRACITIHNTTITTKKAQNTWSNTDVTR
jgi:hypothetical protein